MRLPALALALCLFGRSLPLGAEPCRSNDDEKVEIEEDGFLRWCEDAAGRRTAKQRFDRAGELVRPPPPPVIVRSSSTTAGVVARPRSAEFHRPSGRPFVFSNLGPGRDQWMMAAGLRTFPTLLPAPIPGLDLGLVYAPLDALKFEGRITVSGLVNTIDLSLVPRLLGGKHLSLAPRLGTSLFTSFNDDWAVAAGPRVGLSLSFGSEEAQITAAGELLGYFTGASRHTRGEPRDGGAVRIQLVGEFDLSPTYDVNRFGEDPAALAGRASLYIELNVEHPILERRARPSPIAFSIALGAVF